MQIHVITLFPHMIDAVTQSGVVGRAVKQELLSVRCWNPRDFAQDVHRSVDDRPYGGGPGMVMMVEPLRSTIRAVRQAADSEIEDASATNASVALLSPQGKVFKQSNAIEMSQRSSLILVAGRYEGIDERLIDAEIDEEWSIGDYVLSGGELGAMVMIDSIARLIPGTLGHTESAIQDSFMNGLLDCPHYTRPESVDEHVVPEVLLGGNHKAIERWRLKQSLGRTWLRRPELLKTMELTTEQQYLLQEFQSEHEQK